MQWEKQIWLLALLVLGLGTPTFAQVSKVVADAKGITGTSCVVIMEIALRRLDGVDKISVSISKQRFQITYRPGAKFQPWDIRDAVAKAEVEVLRFQIAARGRVFEDGGKRFFVAGKDKFLLVASPKIPSAEPVLIEGTVDDSSQPLQLKVLQFKLLKQGAYFTCRSQCLILPAALPFILSTAAILAAGLLQRRWIDRFWCGKRQSDHGKWHRLFIDFEQSDCGGLSIHQNSPQISSRFWHHYSKATVWNGPV